MKTHLVCSIGLLVFGTATASGQPFAGADNFNGGEKNSTLWGADGSAGGASLLQAEGRVYHSVSFPAGVSDDIGFWFWNGKASSTIDWAAQMDVHVPVPIAPLGLFDGRPQRYGFGMAVTKTGVDPVLAFMSSSVAARYQSATGSTHDFISEFVNAATGTYNLESSVSGVPLVSIRIRWEAASQTLFSEFDADGPKGGYQWTTLRAEPDNAWAMTAADTFSIFINGFSSGLSLTDANEIYADNFAASEGQPLPILVGIRPAVELFWNSPANRMQQLQSSEDAETWINVGLPTIGNGEVTSVFDQSSLEPNKFYRVIAN